MKSTMTHWLALAVGLSACTGAEGNVPEIAVMATGGNAIRSGTGGTPLVSETGGFPMTATGGVTMTPAGGAPSNGNGSGGRVMKDAGMEMSDADAAIPPEDAPDCTPAPWENPGSVPLPMVTKVEASAGKGQPFGHALDLEAYGYVEEEFFFGGSTPAYRSRFVVLRPSDPGKFSGTVFVEWYNVSGSMDVPVMWSASQEYLKREGHVYIGVSAQKAGVDSLKTVDADRYDSVSHPGDDYANMIFSQAGAAIRENPTQVLGDCMVPRAVIAMGQSQSSSRMVSYLSAAQPADQVYDAILLHSGGTPPTDPAVKTFVVRTMNEGNTNGNGPNKIEWDVAAASHNDKRLTEKSFDIIGEAYGFTEIPFTCQEPMNDYPAYRVYNAVLDWMSRWVRDGERPPEGAPFEMNGSEFALDEHGNTLGGVRLPDVDVPIKTYGKDNVAASGSDLFSSLIGGLACGLAGSATPFSEQKLLELYPTHEDYVQKYTAAADRALAEGFLLKADYDEMIDIAAAAPIPN